LIAKYGFKPREIEKVMVKGSFMWMPVFPDQQPAGPISPQFSMPHAAAMLVFNIPPTVDWYRPAVMKNPAIAEFRKKVAIQLDPKVMMEQIGERISQFPRVIKQVPTTVEVVARGTTFSASVEYAKGDPPSWEPDLQMTEEELKEKFRLNASSILGVSLGWNKKVEGIIDTILNLEKLGSIRELAEQLHI
jgi:2-methylcitrate dehydratase PrpD